MASELIPSRAEPAVKVEDLSKEYPRKLRVKGPTGNAAFNLLLAQMRLPRWLGGRKPKGHNRMRALEEVSFEVPAGQCLGVIGPNGAGKSTLLKVLSRATPPTEGRVTMHGRVASLLELGLGLREDLTGRENVLLAAAMYGVSRRFIEDRLEEIEAFSGLGQMFDEPVKSYSSGMYVRLSFALMINLKPQILLADEILAVGDMQFQEQCMERVRADVAEGLTVLFVSHDMAAIEMLCDKVLWLDKGRVVMLGEPLDVIDAYRNAVHGAGRQLPAPKTKDQNSIFQVEELAIASVKLLSADGKETGHAPRGRSTYVEVALEAHKPGVQARIAVDFAFRNVKAFRSVTPVLTFETPGIQKAILHLPPDLLADNEYAVHVKARYVGRHLADTLSAYNALSFRVYDDAPAEPAAPQGAAALLDIREHGNYAVRPRLEWRVEPGDSPADARKRAQG